MKFETITAVSKTAALGLLSFAVAATLLVGNPAGQESQRAVLGTGASSTAIAVQSNVALGQMSPLAGISNASYATSGMGMRNQGAGAIVISDANKPVKAAFISWAVISSGSPLDASADLRVTTRIATFRE